MKKEKAFPNAEKDEHFFFLYILPLQILPTMRQKKKNNIFKLFHPQNKTTENLNLRIKEATSRILKKNVNLHFHFDDEETYLMSHRRWIGLSTTNSSLNFDKTAVNMKKLNSLGAS